ncbi:major facilitator superfamily domain-containing protein [Dissophora ornata]|nr:major facilitator superfamily domain-containing protein [Dissophora ornata]
MTQRRVGQADVLETEPLLSDARVETYSDHHVESSDLEFETTLPSTQAPNDEEAESAWLAELQNRPWYRRPSIFWMMPFLVVFGIIIGVIGSPMEQLDIQIICKDYLSREHDPSEKSSVFSYSGIASSATPDDRCRSPEVLAFVALVLGRYHAISGFLALLTLAKWASLSDLFGRKVLLRLEVITISLSQLLMWFAASSSNPFGYRLLYANAVLSGFFAEGRLISPAIFSYVADCTSTQERSIMMGYAGMTFALGRIIGPSLGGYIVKSTGDLTSVIKIGLIGFALLFVSLLVIPESLRKHDAFKMSEAATSDMPMNPGPPKRGSFFAVAWESLKRGLLAIVDPLLLFVPGSVPTSPKLPSRYTLALLLVASHLVEMALFGIMALFIPMTNLVFKWTSYEDGHYYSFAAACSFITFLAIFPLLQFLYKRYINRSGQIELPSDSELDSERNETLLGELDSEERQSTSDSASTDNAIESLKMDTSFLLSGTMLFVVAFLIVPLFMTVPMLYVAEALRQIAVISFTANMSMLTTIVPSHQTGKALGALSVSNSIANTVANLLYGGIFAHTSATVPWFYYYVSVGLTLVGCLILSVVWFSYHTRRNKV